MALQRPWVTERHLSRTGQHAEEDLLWLAAPRTERRECTPLHKGACKDERACFGRPTSLVPPTMRGSPHGRSLLYRAAARCVTSRRGLEPVPTRCPLCAVARGSDAPAPRGGLSAGQPSGPRLGCPSRRAPALWLSALYLARALRRAPARGRRVPDHVYADGPRGWCHVYLCRHRL